MAGNSNPGLTYNEVPSPGQWNNFFAGKQDYNPILDQVVANGGAPTFTTPTAWTPADASGAALVFTGVSARVQQIGNMVFVTGQLTYPATASSAAAVIGGLPVGVGSPNYAKVPSAVFNNASIGLLAVTLPGTSTFELMGPTSGAAILNSALSGKTINFALTYPAV